MADYYSTTIIQPNIPLNDLTSCEFLLLSTIFDAEIADDAVYLSSSIGPSDMPEFEIGAVRRAIEEDSGRYSQAAEWLRATLPEADDGPDYVEIDMSTKSFEFVLQEIVLRSPALHYITIVTSYQCSKMRPDGFGGAAILITSDKILGKSTDDLINDFLDEVDPAGEWSKESVK